MDSIDLRISLTAAQKSAWILIRPLLKTYLTKVMRVYRLASDIQKQQLREHNKVLDAVLDMIGE